MDDLGLRQSDFHWPTVAAPPSEKIVNAKNIAVLLEQRFAKVRAEEPCAASDQSPFIEVVILHALFILVF